MIKYLNPSYVGVGFQEYLDSREAIIGEEYG
jgi:hypothetical protein